MRVILAPRATREYEALPKSAARRVTAALDRLSSAPDAANPYVKALVGRKPWLRLRAESYRGLFRVGEDQKVLWVGRIIDGKELDRAVGTLPD